MYIERYSKEYLLLDHWFWGQRAIADEKVLPPPVGFNTYIVQQGDMLDSIAYKEIGYSEYWWMIPQYNPDILFDPTLELTPGATIKIPRWV